ncbi:hypothetical protein ACOKW7_10675 [Limnospira platensis CENA597]
MGEVAGGNIWCVRAACPPEVSPSLSEVRSPTFSEVRSRSLGVRRIA